MIQNVYLYIEGMYNFNFIFIRVYLLMDYYSLFLFLLLYVIEMPSHPLHDVLQ